MPGRDSENARAAGTPSTPRPARKHRIQPSRRSISPRTTPCSARRSERKVRKEEGERRVDDLAGFGVGAHGETAGQPSGADRAGPAFELWRHGGLTCLDGSGAGQDPGAVAGFRTLISSVVGREDPPYEYLLQSRHGEHHAQACSDHPVRRADGWGRQRHFDCRLPLAGAAAQQFGAGRIAGRAGRHAATAGIDADRRDRRRLHRTPAGVDDRRWIIRAFRRCGPGDRAGLRCGRRQRRGARDARGARFTVRPGRHDGPRVDAARGGQRGPAGHSTTPTVFTRQSSTWPISSGPASAAC